MSPCEGSLELRQQKIVKLYCTYMYPNAKSHTISGFQRENETSDLHGITDAQCDLNVNVIIDAEVAYLTRTNGPSKQLYLNT